MYNIYNKIGYLFSTPKITDDYELIEMKDAIKDEEIAKVYKHDETPNNTKYKMIDNFFSIKKHAEHTENTNVTNVTNKYNNIMQLCLDKQNRINMLKTIHKKAIQITSDIVNRSLTYVLINQNSIRMIDDIIKKSIKKTVSFIVSHNIILNATYIIYFIIPLKNNSIFIPPFCLKNKK